MWTQHAVGGRSPKLRNELWEAILPQIGNSNWGISFAPNCNKFGTETENKAKQTNRKAKQRTSIGSRLMPAFPEWKGVLTPHWSDQRRWRRAQGQGQVGANSGPEARCPDSSPGHFPFYKLIVYPETWIIISGAKGRGLRFKHFPVTDDFVNTLSKIPSKAKVLTDCT